MGRSANCECEGLSRFDESRAPLDVQFALPSQFPRVETGLLFNYPYTPVGNSGRGSSGPIPTFASLDAGTFANVRITGPLANICF